MTARESAKQRNQHALGEDGTQPAYGTSLRQDDSSWCAAAYSASATRSGVNGPSLPSDPRTVTDTARMPSGSRVVSSERTQVAEAGLLHAERRGPVPRLVGRHRPVAVTRAPADMNGRAAWTTVSSAPTPSDTSGAARRRSARAGPSPGTRSG